MKKSIYIGALAVIAAACSRQEIDSQDVRLFSSAFSAGDAVTVTVTLPDIEPIETRAALSELESGALRPSWQAGDRLQIGNEIFEISSFDGNAATFAGKVPSGDTFDIFYPPLADRPAPGTLVQTADGDFSHLKYSATLSGVDSFEKIDFGYGWAAEHGGTFSQTGCMKLVLNMPKAGGNITSVSMSGEGFEALSLNVTGEAPIGSYTAYIPSEGIELVPEKAVTITVSSSDGTDYVNTFASGPQVLYGSHLVRLVTAPGMWKVTGLPGSGTETDPYLISSAPAFSLINSKLTLNSYVWFKMTSDIDLGTLTSWTPVNMNNAKYGIMFDGDGHVIRNFNYTGSKWVSIFGVVHGEVKNLTIEDSSVTTTANSPCGLVAAWTGNIDGTLQGRMENVHVINGKVSSSVVAIMGGLSARAGASTILNCSFDGTVERTATTAYSSSYTPIGGLLGEAVEGVSITGCSTSGTLTSKAGRSCGGILGKCEATMDITDCTSTMDITSRDDPAGGIVGYFGTGNITGCSVASDIKVTAKGSGKSYVGGIAGYASGAVTISKCRFDGNLSGYAGYVGGILAQSETTVSPGCTISECYTTGKIATTTVAGGLLAQGSNAGLTVTNCGSSMEVAGTGPYVGGLIADVPKNSTVSDSFAAGAVTGSYAVGGFIGRAYGRQTSSGSLATDVNTAVTGCIAYNPSVLTVTCGGETPSNHYSGGAVIGCSSKPNTLNNCLRRADMVFKFYNDTSLDVLFDHADSSPSIPLVQPSGSAKWFCPYHGKAAAAGQSLSALAISLGWSSSVWDFQEDVPRLKNL